MLPHPPHHLRAGEGACKYTRPALVLQRNDTLVTFLWYDVFAGDGLRSNGVDDLPPSKSVCFILPIARHLRAGTFHLPPSPRSATQRWLLSGFFLLLLLGPPRLSRFTGYLRPLFGRELFGAGLPTLTRSKLP